VAGVARLAWCTDQDEPEAVASMGSRSGERTRGPERDLLSMLRVPTYVAKSPIAGVGLFAATDLPAHHHIWEFTEGVDWRITPSELILFPEPFQSKLRHYLYQEDSGLYVLCGDNAKYMNHSDDPNCDDQGNEGTVTLRAIRAGEELTCDYRLFDLESRTFGLTFDGQAAVAVRGAE
jgi:SET domain-containing protein